jgi:hypothetical protein
MRFSGEEFPEAIEHYREIVRLRLTIVRRGEILARPFPRRRDHQTIAESGSPQDSAHDPDAAYSWAMRFSEGRAVNPSIIFASD